jgi:hypothetical protein
MPHEKIKKEMILSDEINELTRSDENNELVGGNKV